MDAGGTPRRSPRRTPRSASFKERVWALFDDPASSTFAFVLSTIIMLAIALSTLCFIVSSMPRYERWIGWEMMEVGFIALFSVEYVARFYSCPMPKCTFVAEPFNLIDVVAILPFYIEIAVHLCYSAEAQSPDLRVLRTIRLFRIFRVFKLGKYATTLQVLANTVKGSSEALCMLLFCLCVALTFFGAAMFYTERGRWSEAQGCYVRYWAEESCSPFASIPAACYWGITTITTVGYGDVLPTTPMGRFISCLTMVCGILVIALPVTLIGQAFVHSFKESQNTLNAHKVLALSPVEMSYFSARCDDGTQELAASVLTLLPKLRQQLVDAAVATERYDEAGAEAHVAKHLGQVEDLLRHDFRQLTEYTTMLHEGVGATN